MKKWRPENEFEVGELYGLEDDRFHDGGQGRDWQVLRLRKNALTNALPGDIYGHYEVAFTSPKEGTMLQIVGSDNGTNSDDYLQSSASGPFISEMESKLRYEVTTIKNTSGGPILILGTSYLIGTHSHGTCEASGYNTGTSVLLPQFRLAIENCLRNDNLKTVASNNWIPKEGERSILKSVDVPATGDVYAIAKIINDVKVTNILRVNRTRENGTQTILFEVLEAEKETLIDRILRGHPDVGIDK